MGTQTQALIDNSIKKYAGGDAGYAETLKEHVRNAMGYSNYMDKLGQDSSQVADIGDVNGLSYNGIKERINSRFGMQNANIATDQKNMNSIDSAAGTIADSQIAAAKSAASSGQNNTGFQNGVTFQPQNGLETDLLAYMQNPKNADGSVKSLQQFQSEMTQKYGTATNVAKNDYGDTFSQNGKNYLVQNGKTYEVTDNNGTNSLTEAPGVKPNDAVSPDQINATISQKVPKDFIGNEDKYSLMSQGYSEKQAKTLQGALRYDTMTAPEKLIYETTNPTMAKSLQDGTMDKGLVQDLSSTTTNKSGVVQPAYSFTDLQNKYPNVPAATLKALAVPMYTQSASTSLDSELQKKDANGTSPLAKLVDAYTNGNTIGNTTKSGYEGIKSTDTYKELMNKLNISYGDVFATADLERLVLSKIANQLNQQ